MKLLNQLLIIAVITQCILCVCPYGWVDTDSNDKVEKCKVPDSYTRTGYAYQSKNSVSEKLAKNNCEAANSTLGCEKYQYSYYPKCKEGFESDGCCTCKPKDCPKGYTRLVQTISYRADLHKPQETTIFCKKSL